MCSEDLKPVKLKDTDDVTKMAYDLVVGGIDIRCTGLIHVVVLGAINSENK